MIISSNFGHFLPGIAVVKTIKIKLNSKLPSLTFIYKLEVAIYSRISHSNVSKMYIMDDLLTTLYKPARTSFTNSVSDI
jgi:hypothetical protein